MAVTVATLGSLVGFRGLRNWVRRRLGRHTETITFRLAPGVEPAAMIAALNDLSGVNVRNLQVDSSGDATEITVGLKTGVGVPLERMLGDLASRDDVAAMSYDQR